jgi:hypothetical protein
MMDLIFDNQEYLFYLIAVMIIGGIIRDHYYLADIFGLILRKIKSKRLLLSLVSLFGGVLPIPGRVTTSAGVLDSLAPPKGECATCRHKFGIIDYLATHHYYLWSPLEKTIIIPMAALGLTYGAVLGYTWPILAASLVYIIYYIAFKIKEKDIQLGVDPTLFIDIPRLFYGALPLFIGIASITPWVGIAPQYAFSVLALYYIIISKTFVWGDIIHYIKWPLVLTLAVVIIVSNFAKGYYGEIEIFLQNNPGLDIHTTAGFALISIAAFTSAFCLGSSAKFAGLVVILASVYGMEYFTWFFALEYCGYLISPAHKCVHIGRMYFNTPWSDYAKALGIWVVLILCAGVYSLS